MVIGLVLWFVAIKRTEPLSVILLVASLMLMRPTWYGNGATPLGVPLAVAAAFFAASADHREGRLVPSWRDRPRPVLAALCCLAAFQGWYLVLPILHGTYPADFVLRSVTYVLVSVTAAAIVLREPLRARFIARAVVWICGAIAASFGATLLLWAVSGPESHEILRMQLPGGISGANGYAEGNDGQPLYLPWTLTNGATSAFGGITMPRLVGFMREPGLMAPMFIWAIYVAGRLKMRNTRLLQLLLFLGLLGCQSTAGFAIWVVLAVCTSVIGDAPQKKNFRVTRQFLGMALLIGGVWLAIFAPVWGLKAKEEINPGSISDRTTTAVTGITQIDQHFWGAAPQGLENVGINLLSETHRIGGPGLLLALAAYFVPILVARRKSDAAKLIVPLAVTALVAQPVSGAPTWWILVLVAGALDDREHDRVPDETSAAEVDHAGTAGVVRLELTDPERSRAGLNF
ncbi:hypothetical protein JCM9957A_14580 [Kineosporia succinea]